MTALKEEKQDMLIKYHATASKLHEQERRCVELTESTEDVQTQLVKLQVGDGNWCPSGLFARVGEGGRMGIPISVL